MICANLVRSAPRFARPVYYITFRFVCQGVFQKFFQLFSWLSAARLSLRLFGGSAWHYITFSRLCQEVFQKFFQLFSWYSVRRARFSASQIGLRIISHLLDFVKRFFKSFFNFFLWYSVLLQHPVARSECLVDSRRLVDSSHIIALPPPFVKGVFKTFCSLELLALWHNFVGACLFITSKFLSTHASRK